MAFHLKRNDRLIPHTELSIQKLIAQYYRSGMKYIVFNMFHSLGEMDVFCLRRSGYAEEFEVKISTADFKADSKKIRKHNSLQHANSIARKAKYLPNKFSYVFSKDVKYDLEEIPEQYGVYLAGAHWLRCVRTPKFLHKDKYNWDEKVAKSCSWRLLTKMMKGK